MKTKRNKVLTLMGVAMCAIVCAICAVVLPHCKSVFANEIEKPNINEASVQDEYFCLKDYYRIDTPCQASMGNCWIFSFVKTLETNIAMATNEYYDFSEAWLTLCVKMENSMYEIGAGGHQTTCFDVASKYGLLLEAEFPYEYTFGFDDNNYQQIYEMYKDLAHKYFDLDKIAYKNFANTQWIEKSDKILNTKEYLLNYGAISTNINDTEFRHINGRACTYSEKVLNHAVTIIGWDDNLSFKDKSGTNRTGVFIALNSWGEDELICISYDDPNLLNYLYGFEFLNTETKDSSISLAHSNSNFINYKTPVCNSMQYDTSKSIFLNNNIFKYGEQIQLEYQYNGNEANAKIDIKITLNNCDAGDQFSQLKQSGNKIYIQTSKTIDSGTYIITFFIDKENDGTTDTIFKKQIVIFSGTELSYAVATPETEFETYQMMNTVLSTKNKNTVYVFSTEKSPKVILQFGEYSRIKYIFCSDDSVFSYEDYYQYESISPYSGKRISFTLPNAEEDKLYKFNFFVQTYDDNIVQIEINWYKFAEADKRVVAYYSPSKNYDTTTNPKFFVYGENYQVNFLKRSKDKLNNFYYYKNQQKSVEISSDDFVQSCYSNYFDKKHLANYPNFKYEYALVYVEVENNLIFTFEDVDLGDNFHYGMEMNCPIPQPTNIPQRGVVCAIENENWPKGISCDPYTFSLVGVPMSTGNFGFDVTCKFNDNVTSSKTIHVTFSVQKRHIKYKLDSKTTEYGEPLLPLTYKITSGSIVEGDDLQMQFNCNANSFSIGKYVINSEVKNTNYVAICEYSYEPATYTITKRNIKYNLSAFSGVYDGQKHSIALEILNCNTAKVEYSLDNQTFSENAIYFKDATATTKIYIKISDENSNTLNLESSVSIAPKNLSLTNVITETHYNGQLQYPQFDINGIIYDEDAKILISQGQKEVGTHIFTITSNNSNYILNEQLTLVIKKAIPNYQKKLTIEIDKNVKNLSDTKLPDGYAFNNQNEPVSTNKTYFATFTPQDTKHYETIEDIQIVLVKKNSSLKMILILTIPCIVVISATSIVIVKAKTKKLKNVQRTKK